MINCLINNQFISNGKNELYFIIYNLLLDDAHGTKI